MGLDGVEFIRDPAVTTSAGGGAGFLSRPPSCPRGRKRPPPPTRRWRWLAGIILAALLLAIRPAAAIETSPDSRLQSITVVADDTYPPYLFRDKNGTLQGMLRDIWDLWSRKTGIPVNLEGMAWNDALATMQAGRADVIDTIFVTESRKRLFDFSAPYAPADVVVFFHKSIVGITNTTASLRGFAIATKAGDACVEWLKANGIDNVRPYASYQDIFTAALKNDVKVFCMDKPPGLYYLFKNNLQDQFHYTAPLYSGEFHWAVAKGNTALLRQITAGFASITKSEHDAIQAKWTGYLPDTSDLRRHLEIVIYLIGGTAIAVLALLVWNRLLHRRVAARTAELVAAMAALKRSESHFEELVATTPAGVFETDYTGRIVYANDRWLEITGLPRDTAIGGPITAPLPPEDSDAILTDWAAAIHEGRRYRSEHRIRRPDGSIAWVMVNATPQRNGDGTLSGYIGCMNDISERKAAEIALRESEWRFRALYREAPLPYQSLSLPDATLVDVNDAWLELFGYSRDEAIGRPLATFVVGEAQTVLEGWPEPADAASPPSRTITMIGRDGAHRLVVVNGRVGLDAQGQPSRLHCILTDVTERALIEDRLRMLNLAMEQSPVSIVITDVAGVIRYVNPAFTVASGYSTEDAVGKRPSLLKGGGTAPEEYRALWRHITRGEVWRGTFHNRRKDGTFFWEDAVIAPVRDAKGDITHFIGIKQDITARREAEARVAFLAHHDALTKLPNRLLGKDRMEWAIAHADRTRCKTALMLLDLDHFKRVNDSLGHSLGDALLRAVAERLRECVRETDTISRQGGDEFMVVLSEIDDPEAIARIASAILRRMEPACFIGGHELSTTLSIGIAVYPDDGGDFDSLMKRADTAMYHAKEAGRNTYRFFTEQMNIDANEYLAIHNSLQRALDRGELALYYQPQIALDSDTVVGVEALIRWNHPEFGLLPPGRFIPVAEESGLIVPIGDWVLREACRQAAEWQDQGMPRLVMAVNLSGIQFKRGDLLRSVNTALWTSGLDPVYLELEMTESILIRDTENVLSTVGQLKALGVQLSIDDFGTGYSSLAYLKKFNVDKVKIDQSFVRDITSDPNDAAIVHAIVQMAHSLGLKTIAEGVEDTATLEAVRYHQCDAVQGYYFARPMEAAKIPAFLAQHLPPRTLSAR